MRYLVRSVDSTKPSARNMKWLFLRYFWSVVTGLRNGPKLLIQVPIQTTDLAVSSNSQSQPLTVSVRTHFSLLCRRARSVTILSAFVAQLRIFKANLPSCLKYH